MSLIEEIGLFTTALALGNDFFEQKEMKDTKFLDPVIQQLLFQCDGLIQKPGIYAFRLLVSKLK
jgi:hypothetical protein